jgi:protein involved in polysaccharide export with SLBB domain
MRSRRYARLVVVAMAASTSLLLIGRALTAPQEAAKDLTPPTAKGTPNKCDLPPVLARHAKTPEERAAEISKILASYNTEPQPLPPIPDDPPPHEGALISLPYVIEPPDLVLVEVLEALPGRPISGERLVRPDGTITLGFYGDVYVKGLTSAQVKVKIIKHLRAFLRDFDLGLESPEAGDDAASPKPKVEKRQTPAQPDAVERTLDDKEPKNQAKPRTSSFRRAPFRDSVGIRSAVPHRKGVVRSVRLVKDADARDDSQDPNKPATAHNQITVPAHGGQTITITVTIDGQNRVVTAAPANPVSPAEPAEPTEGENEESQIVSTPPDQSDRVFVDITAYNSKNYFIEGDVLITGRLPWTGNDTVLDAIHYSGGLQSTADPKDIRLVRPARGGKPAKIYKIDLAAIQEKGDPTTNYQLFPGDRLVVGRNEVVKKTVELDRMAAPIQAITAALTQEASLLKSMQYRNPRERDLFLKELADFWAQSIAQQGNGQLDDQALRDALMRALKSTAGHVSTTPTPAPAR